MKSAKSSLGAYGQQYERDEAGRISQITYLDADGNPVPTSAGYTILKRTYHRDGTAETDKYFDADGNPMALAKGQYGIRHSGKVNLLLDKNGNIMLCVDNILNGFSATVVVSGVIMCANAAFAKEGKHCLDSCVCGIHSLRNADVSGDRGCKN